MSIENITFEESDNFDQVAIKTVLIYAGTSELKTQMQKLKIDYSKISKGNKQRFVLRSPNLTNGRIEVYL
jgi:hypothetical protein